METRTLTPSALAILHDRSFAVSIPVPGENQGTAQPLGVEDVAFRHRRTRDIVPDETDEQRKGRSGSPASGNARVRVQCGLPVRGNASCQRRSGSSSGSQTNGSRR